MAVVSLWLVSVNSDSDTFLWQKKQTVIETSFYECQNALYSQYVYHHLLQNMYINFIISKYHKFPDAMRLCFMYYIE